MTSLITAEMNFLIKKIQLPENEIINEEILEDDDIEKKSLMNIDNLEDEDEQIVNFDEKKDYELVKILEEILSVFLSNSFNEKSAFHIDLSLDLFFNKFNEFHESDD